MREIRAMKEMKVGTHNGIFHADELVGIAILELTDDNTNFSIIRSRDMENLMQCDILIDIGGGKFDHHIKDFNLTRSTGEKYASAGLVWEAFAEQIIINIACSLKVQLSDTEVAKLKKQIDTQIILPVDMEDNGEETSQHMFSFVPNFLPSWLEEPAYDESFFIVKKVVYTLLKETIKKEIISVVTTTFLTQRLKNVENGILEIPSQTLPWLEDVLNYNKVNNNCIKFIIFPYPSGGWAAQCVPPSFEEKFKQIKPFPKEWSGCNEKTLPIVSLFPDSIFCHNGRFFIRSKSKSTIISMCNFTLCQ